ncbi:Peptidoglycan-associated lipoprotein (fragment) [Candidatus Terasakiella magnetica]
MMVTRRDFLIGLSAVLTLSGAEGTCAAEPESSLPVTFLLKLYFDDDQLTMNQAAKLELDRRMAFLKERLAASAEPIVLEGHSDERGSSEYSLGLAQRRGDAVKSQLVANGIPPERIVVKSFGKERPVDPGHTKAAWAKNRRVDLLLIVP